MEACHLHLANGWTVSISEGDTPPALCSVAAWPTTKHDAKLAHEDWFKFGSAYDCRCWSLDDIRKALMIVSSAKPPSSPHTRTPAKSA